MAQCDRTDIASRRELLCSMHYARHRRGRPLSGPKRGDYFTPIKYKMAHERVRLQWGAARHYPCVTCGSPALHWAYDGTDPTQLVAHEITSSPTYSMHPEFYKPLCASCHQIEDLGRVKHLKTPKLCAHPGCGDPHYGRSLCYGHWRRDWYRRRKVAQL